MLSIRPSHLWIVSYQVEVSQMYPGTSIPNFTRRRLFVMTWVIEMVTSLLKTGRGDLANQMSLGKIR